MLLNLHKKKWTDGLTMRQFDAHSKTNEHTLQVRQGFMKPPLWLFLFSSACIAEGNISYIFQYRSMFPLWLRVCFTFFLDH